MSVRHCLPGTLSAKQFAAARHCSNSDALVLVRNPNSIQRFNWDSSLESDFFSILARMFVWRLWFTQAAACHTCDSVSQSVIRNQWNAWILLFWPSCMQIAWCNARLVELVRRRSGLLNFATFTQRTILVSPMRIHDRSMIRGFHTQCVVHTDYALDALCEFVAFFWNPNQLTCALYFFAF